MTTPELTILYEQGPCLVVWKPPGLLTQAPPGIDSMELRIKRFLQAREGKQHNLYLGVPHRLDRPVSGAMVVARHVRAARRLSDQFEARSVEKRYWALVSRPVEPQCGTWIDFMRKVPDEARSEIVRPEVGQPAVPAAVQPAAVEAAAVEEAAKVIQGTAQTAAELAASGAREAILHYRVRGASVGVTWLEIQLETGRTHQIRLQAAHHGHPILGDELYGSAERFGPECVDPRDREIALHAHHLGFRDPMSQAWVAIDAPLPNSWEAVEFDYSREAVPWPIIEKREPGRQQPPTAPT